MTKEAVIADEVRTLRGLNIDQLRALWRQHKYGSPPKVRSAEMIRLSLAWRIQAEAFGGLDAPARRRLRGGAATGQSDHVSLGVRIAKEWRGQTYEIHRVEGGYRWNDTLYRSLSSLALAITGAKHNGPRFFGLRAEQG